MKIITLDSGVDITGAAVFATSFSTARSNPGEIPHVRALNGLIASHELKTKSSDPMPLRMKQLANQVRDLVTHHMPIAVYIEVPRYAGRSHGVGLERQEDVAKLYQAIGALEVGIHWGYAQVEHRPAVVEVKASGAPKPLRHQLLEAWEKQSAVQLPRGPRGGKQADVWDAIWIGVDVLTSRFEKDLRDMKEAIPA